jgi:hypothetical protein
MPKRPRNGAESRPSRVVAPISVKRCERERQHARVRPWSSVKVDREILHRVYRYSSTGGRHAVHLVDEEHVAALETASGCRRGRAALERGSASSRAARAELARDDAREARLAQPGGPESSTWSSGSPRARAASSATRRFSTASSWPTNSPKLLGRSVFSSSCSGGAAGAPAGAGSSSTPGWNTERISSIGPTLALPAGEGSSRAAAR